MRLEIRRLEELEVFNSLSLSVVVAAEILAELVTEIAVEIASELDAELLEELEVLLVAVRCQDSLES